MAKRISILLVLMLLVASTASASSLLGGVLNTVQDTVSDVTDTVGNVVDSANDTLTSSGNNSGSNPVQSVTDSIVDTVGGVVDTVTDTVDNVVGSHGNPGVVESVTTTVTDTVGGVVDTVTNSQAGTNLTNSISDTVNTVNNTARDALNKLVSGVDSTVGSTVDSLGDTLPVLAPVTDTVRSTVNGVSGLLQNVVDFLLGTVGSNGGNNGGNNGNNGGNSGNNGNGNGNGSNNGGSLTDLIGSDATKGQSLIDLYRQGLNALRAAGQDLPANEDLFLGFGKDIKVITTNNDLANVVFAIALFDKDGHILDVYIDALEGMEAEAAVTLDMETAVASLNTLRKQTDSWFAQVETYQELMRGRTMDEVKEWFVRYFSDVDGRPLMPGSDSALDVAKYKSLTDEEKNALVDITSSATISLNGDHGNIIMAVEDAYTNRETLAE